MEELVEALNQIKQCDSIEQAKLIADGAIVALQNRQESEIFDVDDYSNSTETI